MSLDYATWTVPSMGPVRVAMSSLPSPHYPRVGRILDGMARPRTPARDYLNHSHSRDAFRSRAVIENMVCSSGPMALA
jgi:hypothetical protein